MHAWIDEGHSLPEWRQSMSMTFSKGRPWCLNLVRTANKVLELERMHSSDSFHFICNNGFTKTFFNFSKDKLHNLQGDSKITGHYTKLCNCLMLHILSLIFYLCSWYLRKLIFICAMYLQCPAYVSIQAVSTLQPRLRCISKNFKNKVCRYIPKLQKMNKKISSQTYG